MEPNSARDPPAREWRDAAAEPADVAGGVAYARDLVSSRPLTVSCCFSRGDPTQWVTQQVTSGKNLPHRNELCAHSCLTVLLHNVIAPAVTNLVSFVHYIKHLELYGCKILKHVYEHECTKNNYINHLGLQAAKHVLTYQDM